MEIIIIDRSRIGILLGFSYLPPDEENNFTELNIYLLIICISFIWHEKEI